MAGTRGRETGPSLAAQALELAAEGWAVFPCADDKAPLVERGFHAASADAAAIESMPWERAAFIGAAIPDGMLVLDVDPRNGGDATMAALKAAGHRLPRTRVVATGGGGRHYYFRAPDVELRGKLGQGVDVKRAGRGYVIVPPSPGYRLLKREAPAPLPEWLGEALAAPARSAEAGEAHAPKFMPWEHGTAYGSAALERVLGQLATAPAGGRNDALNRAAFSVAQLVAGGELDGEHAREALEEVAHRIGLTSGETAKTLRSGWEAGLDDPRQAPPREPAAVKPADGVPVTMPVDETRFWLDWSVDEPPPPFLLDPLLPENAYVLVYGATEASKSMVWTALGAEASRRGVRVTLYSLENPPHVDRHRLRRLDPDPAYFRATNEPLDLNDAAQFQALIDRERAWGTRVVLIDTYSHAFASRTEDGNAKAIEFARRVRYLMHEVGCSVVVIDHTGYADHDEPRDASAKRQQVDVAILMEKLGEWRPGAPSRFQMTNRKAARFGNPFTLQGAIHGGPNDPLELRWTGKEPTWKA